MLSITTNLPGGCPTNQTPTGLGGGDETTTALNQDDFDDNRLQTQQTSLLGPNISRLNDSGSLLVPTPTATTTNQAHLPTESSISVREIEDKLKEMNNEMQSHLSSLEQYSTVTTD